MASKKKSREGVQPSREGKEQQTVWIEPEIKRLFKIVAAEEGRSMEEIHVELIKGYLRKRGKLK